MKRQRRIGDGAAPRWGKGPYGNNDPRIKRIYDNVRMVCQACKQVGADYSQMYRAISRVSWTGPGAVKLAAKFKEDYEASPTT